MMNLSRAKDLSCRSCASARSMATGRRPPTPDWYGWSRNTNKSRVDVIDDRDAAHHRRLHDRPFGAVGEEQHVDEDDAGRR